MYSMYVTLHNLYETTKLLYRIGKQTHFLNEKDFSIPNRQIYRTPYADIYGHDHDTGTVSD